MSRLMAKAKRALPKWTSFKFEQPTKSTRTHTKRSPTKKTSKTEWAGRTKEKAARDVLGK